MAHKKKIPLVLFALILVSFCFGQRKKQELDSLFENKVKLYFNQGLYNKSLEQSLVLIEEYEKIGDERKSLEIYIYVANIYSNLYHLRESLQFLDLALKKSEKIKDTKLKSKIYAEYGRNYKNLGFKNVALDYYQKAVDLAIRNQNENKNLLQYYYGLMAIIYEEDKNYESLYKYLHLSHKNRPDVYTSARLAKFFIVHQKKLDSAKYYLNLGTRLYTQKKYPIFQKAILERNWGNYYRALEKYSIAISHYEESLFILKKIKKPQDVKDSYKLLYLTYKTVKDKEHAAYYLERYTQLNDSLSVAKTKLQEISLLNLIKEREQIIEKSTKKKVYFLWIAFLVIIISWWYFNRKISMREKDKISRKNKLENDSLEQKFNESFDEVVQLAKENAPVFLTRFREVYPEVINRIKEYEPSLRSSELCLCAYVYLGFNAKDIARYTHKSINTVRNRKYNLKKKLQLSENTNFEEWLRKTVERE